jgi:hypothetical protein
VVEAGLWLMSKKVLISPISIKDLDWIGTTIELSITKDQVKNSPDMDTDRPISRQAEIDYLGYYSYPSYWGNMGLWGVYSSPYMIAPGYSSIAPQPDEAEFEVDEFARVDTALIQEQDRHLRSHHAVIDYHLEAKDGDLGHVQGMLIDIDTWAIRYLIINTSNWWLGHLVLIAPTWISEVSWPYAKMYVGLTQQQIKDAPVYDPAVPFNREDEKSLSRYYGNNEE